MYNPIAPGDSISSTWGNAVEKALGYGTPAQHGRYVIWKDTAAGTHYARDGTTGERTENDNLADLINEKILALYDGGIGVGLGGSILLKAGNYSLNKTINMKPGVSLVGEGRGSKTIIVSTSLFATADICMVKFDPPTVANSAIYGGLSDMRICGNGDVVTSYPIIDINPSIDQRYGDLLLLRLGVMFGKYGLRINNNTATHSLLNIFVDHCYFEQATYNGILVDSPSDQGIYQCRFTSNHFYGNCASGGNGGLEIDGHETRGGVIASNTFELEKANGIYLADEADGWVIGNNVIIDAGQKTDNTYSGIKLVDVDLCSITGNVSIYRANNKMKYGYEADNNCTYLAVLGNVFKGQTAGASYGTGTGNIGDATMNVDTT